MEHHDDFGGFGRDVPQLIARRDMLAWLGGVSLAGLLAACGLNDEGAATPTEASAGSSASSASSVASETPGGTPAATSTPPSSATPTTAVPGEEIPDEAAGPFPADGSNGPNLLTEDGVARADITRSIGTASGVAEGVPLDIELSVVDAATGAAVAGAAVYVWHCTADGRYSIYEIAEENYLRGVQTSDAAGRLSFTTVFPGCYAGRWPHAHFEVFASLEEAAAGGAPIKTSQLALPEADCAAVYADARYGPSAANLEGLSLTTDGVFRDGWEDQLAVVAGSAEAGYTAALLVRV